MPYLGRNNRLIDHFGIIGTYKYLNLEQFYMLGTGIVTASRGVAVLQRDIGIDSNQTGGIHEIKYQRRQQVIE